MMWGYGDNYMMHGGYWGWGLGWFLSLIFWLIIILAVVWAIKWILYGSGTPHYDSGDKTDWMEEDPAMKILKERYAKGEIDKEEFEAKKKDLMQKQ